MNDSKPNIAALAAEVRSTQDTLRHTSYRTPSDSDIHDLVHSARRTIQARRHQQRVVVSAGTALATAAAVLLLLFWPAWSQPQMTLQTGGKTVEVNSWIRADAGRALPLEFSDGSRIVLEPQARARVVKLTPDEANVILESGRARVSVVPREQTQWTISAGHFEVIVRGTEFDIAWDPETEQLALQMHRGSVSVRGPVIDGDRAVSGTQRLVVESRRQRATVFGPGEERVVIDRGPSSATAAPEDSATAPRQAVTAKAPSEHAPTQPPDPSWQELAREGKHAEAMRAVEQAGFAATCQRLSADGLLQLADVARLAGNTEQANEALRSVRDRFPGSPQAAMVAYSFGRQAFDGAGNYSAAARWFSRYLQEHPGGPLAREALGRLMESQQRLGRTAPARATAKQYLNAYPTGPHSDIARQLLDESPR
jgi:hypothetical protein